MRAKLSLALFVMPILLSLNGASLARGAALRPDAPHVCEDCDEWNAPREPVRLFGNCYFVGTAGLSALLLTSPSGHVLFDGGLPQSAARIDENIRKLGLRTEDIRLIVSSHAHYDHVGGIAALQRASGARVVSSPAGVRALAGGGPTADDPQFGFGPKVNAFPVPRALVAAADGEVLRVGALAVKAHHTPGHTPGGVTWTFKACEGERFVDVVYADSLNPISAPGYRFSGPGGAGPALRRSIDRVAALPCDLLIAVHPGQADLDGKLRARAAAPRQADPLLAPGACRAYAATAAQRLETRLAEERKPSAR